MILESGYIILKPKSEPRKAGKAFEKMHKNGEDKMLMNDVFNEEILKNGNKTI